MKSRHRAGGSCERRGSMLRGSVLRGLVLMALLLASGIPGRVDAAPPEAPRSEARGPVSEGRVEERFLRVVDARRDVRHLVSIPPGYEDDPERRWPLIVGLHGTAGNPEQVMDFPRLRELAERYGYLVVCPSSSGRGELPERYVMQVLDDTESRYRVDPERIFLLGFSRGGAGVWALGAAHAERWAGLAPISPATRGDPAPLERMRDLPIIVVVGDRDEAVSVRSIRRWVEHMPELGMDHRFVELPGMEHDLSKVNFLPLVFEFFENRGAPFPRRAD